MLEYLLVLNLSFSKSAEHESVSNRGMFLEETIRKQHKQVSGAADQEPLRGLLQHLGNN